MARFGLFLHFFKTYDADILFGVNYRCQICIWHHRSSPYEVQGDINETKGGHHKPEKNQLNNSIREIGKALGVSKSIGQLGTFLEIKNSLLSLTPSESLKEHEIQLNWMKAESFPW